MPSSYPTRESCLTVFSRTLIGAVTSQGVADTFPSDGYAAAMRLLSRTIDVLGTNLILKNIDILANHYLDCLQLCAGTGKNALVNTQDGYIARPGDIVCIFLGARAPFILRECSSDPRSYVLVSVISTA